MKSNRNFLLGLISGITLYASLLAPAFSTDDAYLDALEAEAEVINAPQSPKQVTQPETRSEPNNNLKTIQRKIEFTNQLSKELPATTRAFYKLTEIQKKAVIDIYFDNDKSMSKATHLLFNLYFKNKTSQ